MYVYMMYSYLRSFYQFYSERAQACLSYLRKTWRLLQDLAAACRAAAVAPRRIAPGEHFGSPSSEDRCVSEIQQPPVFAGDKIQ